MTNKKYGIIQCKECNYMQPIERKRCGRCGTTWKQLISRIPKLHRKMLSGNIRKHPREITNKNKLRKQIRDSRNYIIK
jgi:hypothetical protein